MSNLKLYFTILTAVVLVGCSPQKRLNRLLMKYPELRDTVFIHDTVEAFVEYVRADTVLRWYPGDTIYLTKDRLRVRTVIDKDTVWQVGECLADTVYVPVEYAVPVVQPTQYTDRLPWWVPLALLALLVILIIQSLRR